MGYTASDASVLMADYYDKTIRESFQEEDNTFRAFMDGQKERTNIRGRRMGVNVLPNASYGSIADGAQLPLAAKIVDVEAKIYYLNQFKTGEMDKALLDQEDDKAFVSFSRRYMERTTETFNQDQNRWMFGTGNGSLGVVSDASGSTTIVFGGDYGSEWIRVNARLNWYSSGNSQRTGGSVSVSTVLTNDISTGTITVDAVPSNLAATDYATYENSQGNAPHGIPYHVKENTDTWLGLSPATYPTLKATRHDADGEALTPGMIDLVIAKSRRKSGVNTPYNDFAILMHPAQEYNYRSLGYDTGAVTQFADVSGSKKRMLDLGFQSAGHNGMMFKLDLDCARSQIWGLRFRDWAIEFIKLPGMWKYDNEHVLWTKSGSGTPYDALQFAVHWRGDLVCKERRNQWLLDSLPYISGI